MSIPVIIFSAFVQDVTGYAAPTFPGRWLIVPVLSVVIFAYCGLPFLSMARTELANRKPGMILIGVVAIVPYSVGSLLRGFA